MKYYYIKYESNIKIASVWVKGGSDKDRNLKKGINQILSSLIIRGCKDFDNYTLSNYISSYGADLNCETFEDGILFNLKSIKSYFKDVYPILKLIIEEPILSKKQFLICKQNILNCIQKSKENPFNIAFENWRKLVYKNHPYAFDCYGYVDNINNISYKDILDEFNNFKARNKILLSNCFYQNMHNIDSLVFNKLFEKKSYYKKKVSNRFNRKCKVHYQNINQVVILLGNKTCSYKNNDILNLKILESYLAFGMSSKLFRIFREKNGLTYDVGVYNPLRKASAPFVVYLSSSSSKCLDTFYHLVDLWDHITSEVLSEKELNLAKIKLNSAILISSQTTEETVNRKVQLMGLKTDPKMDEKLIEMISKIESQEVLETAQKYLINPSLSIIGKEIDCIRIKNIWQNKF